MKSLGTAVVAVLLASGVAGAHAEDVGVRSTWTGFYVGATVGGGWGESRLDGSDVRSNPFGMDGFVAGATVGYNLQLSKSWLVGIEADISQSDMSGSFGPGNLGQPNGRNFFCQPGPCVTDVGWFGTIRGRIGYTFNTLMIYGTGGLAYGLVESEVQGNSGHQVSDINVGWVAGGGLEYAFDPSWSVKLEYLHVDLGWTRAVEPGTGPFRGDAEFDAVRVGLNYRFGGTDRARSR